MSQPRPAQPISSKCHLHPSGFCLCPAPKLDPDCPAPDTPAGSPRWSDRATALATPVVTLILVSVSWFYQCFPEAEEVKSFLLHFH